MVRRKNMLHLTLHEAQALSKEFGVAFKQCLPISFYNDVLFESINVLECEGNDKSDYQADKLRDRLLVVTATGAMQFQGTQCTEEIKTTQQRQA